MARLRKIPYTKPIPAGAEIVTHKGKPHARFTDDGKTVLVPLTKKGDRIRLLSAKWYGEYRDADGMLQCDPLSPDKTAAAQMLADLVKEAEHKKAGLSVSHADQLKRPLVKHLADWARTLDASDVTSGHASQSVAAVRHVLDECRFTFWKDMSASRVQQCLADLRRQGRPVERLDPGRESYTKGELAALLKVSPAALPPLIRRHKLAAIGNGKARRFPRQTAEALLVADPGAERPDLQLLPDRPEELPELDGQRRPGQ